jgi:hypothetical protein
LKKADQSFISLDVSSVYSTCHPENLFLYDNSTGFASDDKHSSSFCFKIRTKPIRVSEYFLPSFKSNAGTPKHGN